MDTLNKYLTIALPAIFIFILGLSVDFVGAQNTSADPAASRRLADIVSNLYLNFGPVTTEDGLSKPIIVGELLIKTGTGYFGTARESDDLDNGFFLFDKIRRQR